MVVVVADDVVDWRKDAVHARRLVMRQLCVEGAAIEEELERILLSVVVDVTRKLHNALTCNASVWSGAETVFHHIAAAGSALLKRTSDSTLGWR